MKKPYLLVIAGVLLSVAAVSSFGSETTMPTVMNTLESTAISVNSKLTTLCLRTLSAALLLQWILSNWKEVFSGELSSQMQKVAGLMTWAGVCFWAMGNQDILSTMFTGYLSLASDITGIKFTPENVWANGVDLQNNMVIAFNKRTGAADSLYSALKNFLPSLLLMFACIMILVCYGTIALSILVAITEFWLMFTVTPIAIAMLGLQAFRDQGMAPLKGVMSLGMRVIILGVIVKVLSAVQAEVVNAFDNMPQVNPMSVVWYALGGVFACAVMSFNAGKIAAAIASGSSNFSGSDAMRGGLQMVGTAASIGTMGATAMSAMRDASGAPPGMGASSALGSLLNSLGSGGGGGAGGGAGGGVGGPPLGVSGAGGAGNASPAKAGGAIPPDPNGAGAPPSSAGSAPDSGGNAAPADSGGGGDASSAGISGDQSGGSQGHGSGGNNGNNKPSGPYKPTVRDTASRAFEKVSQQAGGDNHSVNIQINTRGD